MSDKQECIVVLTPGFAANEDDTTCLPHIQQFILSLKKLYSKKSIVVIAFQYPFVSGSYDWHGVNVIALGGENKTKIFRLITWIKAYRHLAKINKEKKVLGLLSVFHTECAVVGSKFAKRNGLKHYSWLQGQDAKADNPYIKRINAKADEILCLSNFLQNEFYKNHGVKPKYIIDNGITESAFPMLNENQRSIDVLGVGSLIPLKNYTLFIELVHELKNQFPLIRTTIAGKGVEQEKLQAQIDQLGLQENVRLLGLISHAKTLALMNDSKIVLHTSDYEGSCSVLFEALYSGCDVVTTVNPSDLNYPQFFQSTNKQELKEKLIQLLSLNHVDRKRFLYNTMDTSAKNIMALFN